MIPAGKGPFVLYQSVDEYWLNEAKNLGPGGIIFIDTGAILEVLNPNDQRIKPFLESEISRLVTSTYVIHEATRLLVKSRPGDFVGPGGVSSKDLALFFLKQWLVEQNIGIICIPRCVFDITRDTFEEKKHIGCDLTDISSYVVIKGIGQRRIITIDKTDFLRLELDCLP